MVTTYSRGMKQPGEFANPARGRLNRENEYSPVPVRAWQFGLARRVQPSRPASVCSSPHSAWIWSYSRDSSRFPRRRPFIYSNHHTPSVPYRVYRVTQLRTDGVHCRKCGTGPVVLKVVPVTDAAILQVTMDQFIMLFSVFFPFILDVEFVGCTSRGHPGGRSHRNSHPPFFCGACL